MYAIGTVARLAQVSTRTLRHYDAIGLLRPAQVDPSNGYRRYSPDQVRRLHRILVLRDLGVPLAEIATLVDDDVTLDQIQGILRLRRAEVQAQVTRSEQQLRWVERRLAQLQEETMTDLDVIVKAIDPVRVVALHEDLADDADISAAADRLYPRLHAALGRRGIQSGGLSLALYDCIDDEQHPVRFTAALPVPDGHHTDDDRDPAGSGHDVTVIPLPPIPRAATTVLRGAPEMFAEAFTALHHWAEQMGESATGHVREVYLDCDGPRDTWVTELQVALHHRHPS